MVKRKHTAASDDFDDQGTPISHQDGASPVKRQFVALHKSRFLDWAPTAAVACATTDDGLLMAVARESGNIELWDIQHWTLIKVLHGSKDMAVSCLAWMTEAGSGQLRLISGGLDGFLVDWDLKECRPAARTDALGGAVWALAQSSSDKSEGSRLAVACDDGCARLFSLQNGQAGLVYSFSLPPLKGRLLSLDWHPNGRIICTGTSEASLHAWDTVTRREVLRIHTGDESKERHDVWAVSVLEDGTMVSGDGGGNLQFWDAAHGSCIVSLKQHQAGILAIAASRDGRHVFASGADSQIAVFGKISAVQDGSAKWEFLDSKRPHTHDVRFLTIVGGQSADQLLVSGGNDALLFAYSVDAFVKEHPARLTRAPEAPSIHMCRPPQAGHTALLMSSRHELCQLWRVDCSSQSQAESASQREGLQLQGFSSPELLEEISLKQKGHISVSALAENGKWLVIGGSEETVVYSIKAEDEEIEDEEDDEEESVLREISVKGLKDRRWQAAAFCNDRLFIVDSHGLVFTAELSASRKVKLRKMAALDLSPADSEAQQTLSALLSSLSGCAGSESAGLVAFHSHTEVHIVSLGADSKPSVIRTPQERGLITSVAFKSGGKRLLVGTSSNELLEYEVDSQQLMPFSKQMKLALQHKLSLMPSTIVSITCLPSSERDIALVVTSTAMLFVDFDAPVTEPPTIHKRDRWRMLASREEALDGKIGSNLRIVRFQEPCLACCFVSEDILIHCEKAWRDVQIQFPAPVVRHVYGS